MKHKRMPSKLGKLLVTWLLASLTSLSLLVTLALAIDLPSAGSVAILQTTGPNATLGIGDWYTNSAAQAGNRRHNFKIFVPCTTIPPAQVFTIELFDPEAFGGLPDEIRPTPADPDDTNFTLLAPDNSIIVATTYIPSAATDGQFVTFATFTTGASGCGIYTLLAQTSNDDDNSWSLRITPDDPDGAAGSGDEILLASFETSFQYSTDGCQDFFFFVPVIPSIRLNNFDMDAASAGGFDALASVTYFPPGGAPAINGSASGAADVIANTGWNNGGSAAHPPPGGDVINNPASGWWQAQVCLSANNQYIFEAEGLPYFFEPAPFPEMTVNKDDGLSLVFAGQTITYTLSYANIGTGAALNVTLNDTIPASTTFVSCSGGLFCAETSPGVVSYTVGAVPAGTNGQLFLALQLDQNFPPSSSLTNTVQLNYQDTMGNSYPPVEARDVNQTGVPPDLSINKTDGGISTTPGGIAPYTLTYSNTSVTGATGVVITDVVPAHASFNAAAGAPTVWSCADGSPAGTVCTTTIGAVPGNSNGTAIFAVNVDNPLPAGVTEIGNTVTIGDDGANGPDPTPGNNSSSDTTPVSPAPPPELQLTKSNGGITAGPSGVIVYTLTYSNTSATGATGVVITDTTPAHTTFNAAASAPTVWSCANGSPAGTVCTTTLGAAPGNSSGAVAFAVTVNNPLPADVTGIVNTAVIGDDRANGVEADLSNNSAANLTPLISPPDQAPPAGSNYDDDDDDDDGDSSISTPQPPSAPASISAPEPSPAAQPTPPLPVLLLPETGLRETQSTAAQVFLLLALLGITIPGVLYLLRGFKAKE